jgi:glycosyltransferase involved in cell wall biosynthesis
MRIVHVEDFLQPDAGYQVNILSKLQVEQGHEVVVVTSELNKSPDYLTSFFGRENIGERDRLFHERTGARIIRVPLIGVLSGRAIYYPRIFRIVDELGPDVLYVHGEDTMIGMQFIVRSLWQKYPMILDCHMLEGASMNRFREVFRFFFRHLVTPIIIRNRIPLIRVVDTDYVEKCLGLPLNKTVLLSFGSDTNRFRPDGEARRRFRERHGIPMDDFVVLYAGKLDEYKGGLFFANALERRLTPASRRRLRFLVVGSGVSEYGQKVDEIFSRSENEVLRFPTQPHHDLQEFYQGADIAVFPKQCSLSFFDVQACGLPVLLEENDINSARVAHDNGLTFRPGDVDDFRQRILDLADMDSAKFNALARNARALVMRSYDYTAVARQFTDILQSAYDDFHARRAMPAVG